MAPPKSKKRRTANKLQEVTETLWNHYRNYLDSCGSEEDGAGEQEGGPGDVDELQEVVEIAAKHDLPAPPDSLVGVKDTTSLLSLLVSVACYHLADFAITKYLEHVQDHGEGEQGEAEREKLASDAQGLISKSISSYPKNAGAWSMGANYGRMSHRLSLTSIRSWYERAVAHAGALRAEALQVLQDEKVEDSIKEWIELLVLHQMVGVEFIDSEDEDEQDDDDEDGEEDIEKEGDEDGHYSTSAVEETSRFMLGMLLSTAGDHDRALGHLEHFALTHRLHPNVWIEKGTVIDNGKEANSSTLNIPVSFRPNNGILPDSLYQSMLKIFAPNAAFWKESDYSNRGYYSFFTALKDISKTDDGKYNPSNLIEDMILNYLMPRAQQILDKSDKKEETISGFEWWAHMRPVAANLGHNLHFDTDEALLAQDAKITHPILSSVLYLSGGDDSGATIILDQTPESEEVANFCYKSYPKDNSFMIFSGDRLHGVLPCPGTAADESRKEDVQDDQALLKAWTSPPAAKTNRITFMVGFWTRNVPDSMKNRHLYGPCGPLPPPDDDHTWVRELTTGYPKDAGQAEGSHEFTAEPLPRVSPAWETIKGKESGRDAKEVLEVPHSINHRFFVKDAPGCFRESLFEDVMPCGDDDDDEDEDED